MHGREAAFLVAPTDAPEGGRVVLDPLTHRGDPFALVQG
jgi:hypothetical protein